MLAPSFSSKERNILGKMNLLFFLEINRMNLMGDFGLKYIYIYSDLVNRKNDMVLIHKN